MPPNEPLPSRRILVVDDTVASAKMLTLVLKSLGQQVELCTDGPTALIKVLEFRPELIFLDIVMPGMNGYEVAVKLKSNTATAQIVLVALTGFDQDADRKLALESGFDHHLTKPASMVALKEVIRAAK